MSDPQNIKQNHCPQSFQCLKSSLNFRNVLTAVLTLSVTLALLKAISKPPVCFKTEGHILLGREKNMFLQNMFVSIKTRWRCRHTLVSIFFSLSFLLHYINSNRLKTQKTSPIESGTCYIPKFVDCFHRLPIVK